MEEDVILEMEDVVVLDVVVVAVVVGDDVVGDVYAAALVAV